MRKKKKIFLRTPHLKKTTKLSELRASKKRLEEILQKLRLKKTTLFKKWFEEICKILIHKNKWEDKKSKLGELVDVLWDIDIKGGNLENIYRCFWGHNLNPSQYPITYTLKYQKRDTLSAIGKIKKLQPLWYSEDIEQGKIDCINEDLNKIQHHLPDIIDEYFKFKEYLFYGKTIKELEFEEERLKKDKKNLLDNERIFVFVNHLKKIGFSENKAFRSISIILKFSPPYQVIEYTAIRQRYKRYSKSKILFRK